MLCLGGARDLPGMLPCPRDREEQCTQEPNLYMNQSIYSRHGVGVIEGTTNRKILIVLMLVVIQQQQPIMMMLMILVMISDFFVSNAITTFG